jgi:drug/metabolite transporter (DMT)-like permease
MGSIIISAIAAIAAGMALAATGVLQQRAASSRPSDERFSLRMLATLAHNKIWLAGLGAAVLSYGFQAVALAFGPLALVQPLVVSELLFAVPISAKLRGIQLGRREWTAVFTVVVGLGIGIASAHPRKADPLVPISLWAYALGGIAVLVVLAVLIGRRLRGPAKASLFALAGASVMALQSALYKATIVALRQDKLGVFLHWQAYALIIASFLGLYLVQNAYQAGPLAASMPVMDAVLPTVAIALGVGLFGEPINTSWWGLTGASAGLMLLIIGIVALDTSGAVRRQQQIERKEKKQPAQQHRSAIAASGA